MKQLIGCCGLDCEKCAARKATFDNDNALRENIAKLWSELNGVKITPEMINCEGCRAEGVKTPYCENLCQIRQCALGKNHETCGNCTEIDNCKTINMIISNNPEVLENLKNK